MSKKKIYTPDWTNTVATQNSYRQIFKWGAPDQFKHPKASLYKLLKEQLQLTDDDFKEKQHLGHEKVHCDNPIKLSQQQINTFKQMIGDNNVTEDPYSRVKYASGKTMEEAINLRHGICDDVADIVVHPRSKEDIQQIVHYCNQQKIPIYIYSGGSSVNFGFSCVRGGISMVMATHMTRVLDFNETNETITVEPGISGPDYEKILNHAQQEFKAKMAYTGGHFPQSFEFSTVGGWVSALGSGQQSSYYGDVYDLVLNQEYVTPLGTFKTLTYPATATGPKVNDIMKGSEGAFGVLVSATLKFFRHMPENRQRFSFIFPNWQSTVNAAREISQGEFGMPAVFRISDPEETELVLRLYGITDTIFDHIMKIRGLRPKQRCLYIGHTEGDRDFSKLVKKKVKKIAKKHGAIYLTGYPVKNWEHSRYTDPYMREDLQDYGIIVDTLESAVCWDNLHKLHQGVRNYIKSRANTICMTHASHFYPQGTNLYFIFIAKMKDINEYKSFQSGIIDCIDKYGGSLSHHHGVGKMLAPWMAKHLGKTQMDVLRALKTHFDPNNIMNPGGTLGLDLD